MDGRYKSALVAIAKDEDDYIAEWLAYYDKLGVSEAFVYLDRWDYSLDSRLALKQMKATLIPVESVANELNLDEKNVPDEFYRRQIACYNHWLSKHKDAKDFSYAMFFDIDEFLVVPGMDLQKFFKQIEDLEAVGINWKIFGDSGLSFDGSNYSVVSRFVKASRTLFRNGKACVNLKAAKKKNYFFKTTMHTPYGLDMANAFKALHGSKYSQPRGWVYTTDSNLLSKEGIQLYLAHFRNKTREECLKKCALHTMHQGSYMDKFEENFLAFNCNDVEDFTLKSFMENDNR